LDLGGVELLCGAVGSPQRDGQMSALGVTLVVTGVCEPALLELGERIDTQ